MERKDIDMVDHPTHYEKGAGHVECIDLLRVLTEGYSGIAAMEVGQFKYLYRMGSKSEEGLSQIDKSIEDVKKLIFYMKDFEKHACAPENGDYLMPDYACDKKYRELEAEFIAQEFTFDKPESIKDLVKRAVKTVYCITATRHIHTVIDTLEEIVKRLQKEPRW